MQLLVPTIKLPEVNIADFQNYLRLVRERYPRFVAAREGAAKDEAVRQGQRGTAPPSCPRRVTCALLPSAVDSNLTEPSTRVATSVALENGSEDSGRELQEANGCGVRVTDQRLVRAARLNTSTTGAGDARALYRGLLETQGRASSGTPFGNIEAPPNPRSCSGVVHSRVGMDP